MNVKDLAGQRFGRLVPLRKTDMRLFGRVVWECQCDCGNIAYVHTGHLKSGHTRSCGCLRKDFAVEHFTTHGGSGTRLVGIWYEMRKRCRDSKCKHFKHYGGKGIKVCDEWQNSFEAFRDWALANGYADNLTIDRIDVNGDYCPENCRWATREVQSNNTGANHYLTHNGETHTLSEWAKITGIKYSTLRSRINLYGWDAEKALTVPANIRRGTHDQ